MSTMSMLFSLSHGSLDVTKLSPVPQITSPWPEESLSRSEANGVRLDALGGALRVEFVVDRGENKDFSGHAK